MLAESHITGIPQKAALTDWKKVLIPFVYFFSTKHDVGSAVSIYISNRFCISKIMKICLSCARQLQGCCTLHSLTPAAVMICLHSISLIYYIISLVLYWFHFITLIFWVFFNIGKRVISNCSFVLVMEAPIFFSIIPVLLFCKQAVFV